MKNIAIQAKTPIQIFSIDAVLLSIAAFIPALSHISAIPIYQFNPMLLLLMLGVISIKNQWNAHILAVLMPLVSCLATGMPTMTKTLCMIVEYNAVLFAYFGLINRNVCSKFVIVLLSIMIGKVVYYCLKTLLIGSAQLVSTPVIAQVLSCIAIAFLFSLLSNVKTNRDGR